MANDDVNKDDIERHAHLSLLTIQKALMDEYNAGYQSWLRYLITLAAGALTALVSLHSIYIPHVPKLIWLLQSCWLLLSGSIILGQLSLYGQIRALYQAATRIGDALAKKGDDKLQAYAVATFQGVSVTPSKIYHYMYLLSVVCFALALIFLALFAALNFPVSSPPKP